MKILKVKTAKGFKDLENQIRKDVHIALQDSLETEVFTAVKEAVIDRVQKDVYDVYSPQVYKRRSDGNPDGGQGLGDKSNVVYELEGRATKTKGKTLTVWNIAKPNPRNNPNQAFSTAKRKDNILQKIIIDGWTNAGADAPVWRQPRPFIERAIEALAPGGEHRGSLEEAFDMGLARHGFVKTG